MGSTRRLRPQTIDGVEECGFAKLFDEPVAELGMTA
jgi:hypothetical protein